MGLSGHNMASAADPEDRVKPLPYAIKRNPTANAFTLEMIHRGDRLTLDEAATVIQSCARRMIARRGVKALIAAIAASKVKKFVRSKSQYRQDSFSRTPEAISAQIIQSGARGSLARKKSRESEEALETHLNILQEVEEEKREDQIFDQLESLIGQDDKTGFLQELEAKKKKLLGRIEQLRLERYYLPAAEQRKASREIKKMQDDLASSLNEIRLVKEGTVADKAAAKKKGITRQNSSRSGSAIAGAAARKKIERRKAMVWDFLRASKRREHADLEDLGDIFRQGVHSVGRLTRVSLEPQLSGETVSVRASIVSIIEDRRAQQSLKEANDEARRRTEIASTAKLHPQGFEAAIRKTLLQTEVWNPSVREASRHCKNLREDIERIELQLKLARRAVERATRDIELLEKPQPISSRHRDPKKIMAELEDLRQRNVLLTRYQEMLEATQQMLMQEAKHMRRSVLKGALRKKRADIALADRRDKAARCIQLMYRTRLERKSRQKMVEAARQEKIRALRERHSQAMQRKWSATSELLTGAERAIRRAHSAVVMQHAARERQWQRHEQELAKQALARTRFKHKVEAGMMSAMRFGSQRQRLLAREQAFQDAAVGALKSRQRRFVDTDDEKQEREDYVKSLAHRAAHAAQQCALTMLKSDFRYPPLSSESQGPPPARPTQVQRPLTAPSMRPSSPAPVERPATTRGAPRPRPPPTARPTTARAGVSARKGMYTVPAKRSNIDAVTDAVLRRKSWTQTPMNRAVLDEAAAVALAPCLDRMAAQAVGSGAKAAVLLAKRACEQPPSRLPEFENVPRRVIFANPRLDRAPESATAKIAAAWDDSRFHTANIKERTAMMRRWRAHHHAWVRAGGVRRQVLMHEEYRRTTLAQRTQRDVDALHTRMQRWQHEDDAVLLIQAAWYDLKLRRKELKQMDVAMQIKNSTLGLQAAKEPAKKRASSVVAASNKMKDLMSPSPPLQTARPREPAPTRAAMPRKGVPAALPSAQDYSVDVELFEVAEIRDPLGRPLSAVVKDISSCLDDVLASLRRGPAEETVRSTGMPSSLMAPLA